MKRLTWSTPMIHEVQDRITPGGGTNTDKVEGQKDAFGTGEFAAGTSLAGNIPASYVGES